MQRTSEDRVEPELVGRTFDDFLFRPQHGVVASRRSVALKARLSRHLEVSLPVVAANMDSVTRAAMAKTVALEGGLGIIHRGMPIEEQAREVARVKRSHGYSVDQPLSLPRTATLREARRFTKQHNITGILIEEAAGTNRLAGLLSNRDMPWTDAEDHRRVDALMTPFERLVVARPGISREDAERLMFERRIEKLPIVDADRHILGLITKRDLILARQRPHSAKDARGRLLVGAAIGAHGDYLERAFELVAAGSDVLVVDIAHGHSDVMRHALEALRARFGAIELIAGNVGTAEGARFLRDVGADAVKVGIGPGRGCRTRLETAAGVPQLQAIREAWRAVGDTIPIIADGGVKNDKDLFLAMICGASTVMLGGMLSGTDEAPGHVIVDPATGQKKKIYRGMTSPEAVLQALYDDDPEAARDVLATPAEGQEIQVPYKGSVVDILHRIRGHLASSVSYAGGASLEEVRERIVPRVTDYLVPLSPGAYHESYQR
ncbi:IMP dehydrogenase [Myxococcota bacterium]|nr:IMP dehydrogenase [Myxococcota bacterium]